MSVSYPLRVFFDCSTAHLSTASRHYLDDQVARTAIHPESWIAKIPYGWFVWAAARPDNHLPVDLSAITRRARERRSANLRLVQLTANDGETAMDQNERHAEDHRVATMPPVVTEQASTQLSGLSRPRARQRWRAFFVSGATLWSTMSQIWRAGFPIRLKPFADITFRAVAEKDDTGWWAMWKTRPDAVSTSA